jgi:hypothetical protein
MSDYLLKVGEVHKTSSTCSLATLSYIGIDVNIMCILERLKDANMTESIASEGHHRGSVCNE